jgi:hypothetical protein
MHIPWDASSRVTFSGRIHYDHCPRGKASSAWLCVQARRGKQQPPRPTSRSASQAAGASKRLRRPARGRSAEAPTCVRGWRVEATTMADSGFWWWSRRKGEELADGGVSFCQSAALPEARTWGARNSRARWWGWAGGHDATLQGSGNLQDIGSLLGGLIKIQRRVEKQATQPYEVPSFGWDFIL